MALADALRRQLDARGSTRGFALFRILLITVLFYETSQGTQLHPGYFDAPLSGQMLLLIMLLSTWAAWLGYKTRLATALLAITYGYVHVRWGLVDHRYWAPKGAHMTQALIVLALVPSGRSLSIDRWLEVRRARRRGERPPAEEGPVWAVMLMVVSLSCMYLWCGLDMLEPVWRSGEKVEMLWITHRRNSDAFAHHPELLHAAAVILAWLALVLTWTLAIGLLIPRLRPIMIIVGLALHGGVWLVLGGWPFTYVMVVTYVVLVDPDRVHRFFDTIFDVPGEAPPPPT